MFVNLDKFNELVDQKYLRKVISPCEKLVLFTYTDKCTFERYWTKETRMARGLIVEIETGLVVAKPFEKFFNLGESEETYLTNLPNCSYTVQEKLDGSLGIVYYYGGKWNVATKGSFTSDQAIKATAMLEMIYDTEYLNPPFTYLVEIIYPENKIVVNYEDDEKLVLLSVIDTKTFHEYSVGTRFIESYAGMTGFSFPLKYNYTISQMIELQKTLPKDQEGFVVRYENGLRLKIKGEEYLRIHKMISHMTPLAFWEVMKDGKVPVEYLQQLPEEFRPEFEVIVKQLENQYKVVFNEAIQEFLSIPDKSTRKTIGLYLKDATIKHTKAMFSLLDGKSDIFHDYILKQIRPKANEFKEI